MTLAIYLIGCIAAVLATVNIFRRNNWEMKDDWKFVLSIIIFSWIGLIAVLTSNKQVFGKWWNI